MSVLDTLIQMKTQAKRDDLMDLFDELIVYEKLKKSKTFKMDTSSPVAKKKLPLMANAWDGDMYCISLLILADRILAHLMQNPPRYAEGLEESLTERERKQFDIITETLIPVEYMDLSDYDHEREKDNLLNVFVEDLEKKESVLIVTRKASGYRIYEGYLSRREIERTKTYVPVPYRKEGPEGTLVMETYSVLGNNGYPFASFETGSLRYRVWMPEPNEIWLEGKEQIRIPLTGSEVADLGMVKADPRRFANTVYGLIVKHGSGDRK